MDCLLARSPRQAKAQSKPAPSTDGARAEQLAVDYLQSHGLRILARNFRCRGGELDIVAEQGGTIAFIEVRLRQRHDFGGAAGSISATKQRRIILAARHWLHQEKRFGNRPCRFDAILLDRPETSAIEWLRDAFSADASD